MGDASKRRQKQLRMVLKEPYLTGLRKIIAPKINLVGMYEKVI